MSSDTAMQYDKSKSMLQELSHWGDFTQAIFHLYPSNTAPLLHIESQMKAQPFSHETQINGGHCNRGERSKGP